MALYLKGSLRSFGKKFVIVRETIGFHDWTNKMTNEFVLLPHSYCKYYNYEFEFLLNIVHF